LNDPLGNYLAGEIRQIGVSELRTGGVECQAHNPSCGVVKRRFASNEGQNRRHGTLHCAYLAIGPKFGCSFFASQERAGTKTQEKAAHLDVGEQKTNDGINVSGTAAAMQR
jgi:hypothetical protein